MEAVFSRNELNAILNHPEVLSAKSRLGKQVYFEIKLTCSQKQALNRCFGLNLDKVPMRWIQGDTPSHIDNGTNESGTYLVYLTDSPGKLVIGDNEHPIKKNAGHHFNENVKHYTTGTSDIPRLVMGPMNNQGQSVGGTVLDYFSNPTDALNFTNSIARGASYILGDSIFEGSIGGITDWKIVTFDNPHPAGTINPGVYTNGTDISLLSPPVIGTYGVSVYPANWVCFLEGSTILTNKGYKFVEDLKQGDLVKTLTHGFVPVYGVGSRKIVNRASETRIKNQLYLLSKSIYPELTDNLVITGSHSLLVDQLPTDQIKATKELLGNIYVTEGKYRLPVCLDQRSIVYPEKGEFTIYHVCLENESESGNYAMYANGTLLVESCCRLHFDENFKDA